MKSIVITGPDASGKDTQIEMLADYLKQKNLDVQTLSIWDSLQDFHSIGDAALLQRVVETFLLKFAPEARSLFLAACLKNAVSKIRPDCDVVLINGYYIKYWASELSYGVNNELWQKNLSTLFSTPDFLFFIEAKPDITLSRRTKWSSYEQGKALPNKEPNLNEFQHKTYLNFKKILTSFQKVQNIDGSQSKSKIHQDIIESLHNKI